MAGAKEGFKLNLSGGSELLRSSGMRSMLEGYASRFASSCGQGYAHDTYMAGSRWIASVYTADFDAMLDDYRNNTLKKVCGIG